MHRSLPQSIIETPFIPIFPCKIKQISKTHIHSNERLNYFFQNANFCRSTKGMRFIEQIATATAPRLYAAWSQAESAETHTHTIALLLAQIDPKNVTMEVNWDVSEMNLTHCLLWNLICTNHWAGGIKDDKYTSLSDWLNRPNGHFGRVVAFSCIHNFFSKTLSSFVPADSSLLCPFHKLWLKYTAYDKR